MEIKTEQPIKAGFSFTEFMACALIVVASLAAVAMRVYEQFSEHLAPRLEIVISQDSNPIEISMPETDKRSFGAVNFTFPSDGSAAPKNSLTTDRGAITSEITKVSFKFSGLFYTCKPTENSCLVRRSAESGITYAEANLKK